MTLKYPGQGRMLPAIRHSSSGTCIFGAEDPASKASNAPSSIHNNSSHSTPFTISHVNICIRHNKIYELCRIWHSHDIAVLAVSESRLDSSVPDAPVYVPGYTIHRHDRLTGQGGGVCFFCEIVDCGPPLLEFRHNRSCLHYCVGQEASSLIARLCVQTPSAPVSYWSFISESIEKLWSISSCDLI